MSKSEVVPSGTKVTYHGGVSALAGLTMTVVYKSSCGSCAHGGTYVLEYVSPSTGQTKRLEKAMRTSFTVIGVDQE